MALVINLCSKEKKRHDLRYVWKIWKRRGNSRIVRDETWLSPTRLTGFGEGSEGLWMTPRCSGDLRTKYVVVKTMRVDDIALGARTEDEGQ